ncbi:MAG: HD-GYP domain-containing protein [Gammaproteobacteria bacterium]
MLLKRLKIDTANLECGMYVAQLDRPWLETPFLFQGFEIRDDKDLQQIRHYCQHVYVDATRGSMPTNKVLAARRREDQYAQSLATPAKRLQHPPPRNLQRRLFDAIARLDRSGRLATFFQIRHYRNLVSTRVEAPKAVLAYDAAARVLINALEQFQQGKPLDAARLKAVTIPLIDSILRNQDAMAWLVCLRKREPDDTQRSIGSAVWAVILGRHLGFDRAGLQILALGGMLLDLGNARLPGNVLAKTGPLDETERAIVRKHVAVGLGLVKATSGLNADVIAMIQHHHERHDGSGYPAGLAGTDIPVFGRIAGLVDCFDAMTTKRPYAAARSPYDAIRELNSQSGTVFQKELIEHFVQAVGMFPTGSLVELNTGEVALVIEQNRVRRLRPKLMLLLDSAKRPVGRQVVLDLKQKPAGVAEGDACWILHGLEPGAYGLDPKDYFGNHFR